MKHIHTCTPYMHVVCTYVRARSLTGGGSIPSTLFIFHFLLSSCGSFSKPRLRASSLALYGVRGHAHTQMTICPPRHKHIGKMHEISTILKGELYITNTSPERLVDMTHYFRCHGNHMLTGVSSNIVTMVTLELLSATYMYHTSNWISIVRSLRPNQHHQEYVYTTSTVCVRVIVEPRTQLLTIAQGRKSSSLPRQ